MKERQGIALPFFVTDPRRIHQPEDIDVARLMEKAERGVFGQIPELNHVAESSKAGVLRAAA